MDNYYSEDKEKRKRETLYSFVRTKDKHVSYIDSIPEQYKRKDYIIDKLNCKKKNVD